MKRFIALVKLLLVTALLAALVGCASSERRESTGQFVDDSVITTKVKAAFFEEPSLKVFQINVKTYRAVVQLSGFVDNKEQVKTAGEVAAKVEGVKSVENSLLVK